MRPFGIHTISDIYSAGCEAGLPDGTCASAVAEPYTGNRLVAAWWVLTGRAFAFKWPRAGDLERALDLPPKYRIPWPQAQQAHNSLKSLHKAIAISDTDPTDNANPFRTTP